MSKVQCSVPCCKNFYRITKQEAENTEHLVSYHRLPKKDSHLCKQWIEKCRIKENVLVKNIRICSMHFVEDDFVLNPESRVQKLKSTAVPSRHLTPCEDDSPMAYRSFRQKYLEISKQNSVLEEQNRQKSLTIAEQKNKIVELEATLASKNAEMEQTVEHFKTQIKIVSEDLKLKHLQNKEFEKVISSVLSAAQLKILTKKNEKVHWNIKDIAKAFTIRYFSKRCYLYLKKTLNFPLPGLSTLQQWAAKINVKEGVLHDILYLMQISGHAMTAFERVVILQFDEMKVSSILAYDTSGDEIVGPYSQMQVVMARGLFANWKQPVYVAFDTKMTKTILLDLIVKLHQISYTVVACVSDCGGGNIGLWKELQINVESTYFVHPVLEEKIYFFADAPHLIKLLRNWFLDTGFMLQDGTKITSELVKKLVSENVTEISALHKLNQLHITCEGAQRQNVALATQLLSHTTATAIRHYLPTEEFSSEVAEFIERSNNWFDVMNSFSLNTSVLSKKPYGVELEHQNKILEDMYEMVVTMRCCTKQTLQIFQKGLLISITSLKMLFNDMKEKYGISYILTHRLNQDSLENFFSQLRTRGGLYDHPSPLHALYRIRMIILGKNPTILQKNVNTKEQGEQIDEYLLSEAVLKKAKVLTSEVKQYEAQEMEPDSDSLSSVSSNKSNGSISSSQPVKESDGFHYLIGWIAKKFMVKYPDLGTYTYKSDVEHDYTIPEWIRHLSLGGLVNPSSTWFQKATVLEKIFQKFHGCDFKRGKNITKKLLKIMKKKK